MLAIFTKQTDTPTMQVNKKQKYAKKEEQSMQDTRDKNNNSNPQQKSVFIFNFLLLCVYV